MPKFGFYMQDALRWAEPDDKTHPGHDIGCHLALRKSAGGDSEVYIKKIVPGGPVALSAALATGDVIAEIDGINPLEAKDGSQTLHTLLEGELGTAVWLKVRGAHHVPLIRSKALKVKPQGSSHAGLGFSYRELLTVDPDGGVLVTAVHPGGALWLHGQIYRDSVSLRSGDIITHVDGKPVGADSAFKGEPFSRVRIAGKRADSGSGFEIDVIRAETLANRWLQQVEDYRKAVECIPPAPPSDRVNANSGIQIMSAPLINGLDINTAARMVITAYIEQANEPTVPESPDVSGAASDTQGLGAKVSPTDLVSSLDPEVRYNAVAMVCAIAAPNLVLHRKLRRQALRCGDLPRVPDHRERLAASHGQGAVSDAAPGQGEPATAASSTSPAAAPVTTLVDDETSPAAAPMTTVVDDQAGGQAQSWAALGKASVTQSVTASVSRANAWLGNIRGMQHSLSQTKFPWSASDAEEEAEQLDGEQLWHHAHVDLLRSFMQVPEGRSSTLTSILHCTATSPELFAGYILDHEADSNHTSTIIPEGAAPDTSDASSDASSTGSEPQLDETVQADSGRTWGVVSCTPCTPGVQRQPWTICWLVLAASVGARKYDSRSRAVIRHVAQQFQIPWQWVRSAEIAFAKEIIKCSAPASDKEDDKEDSWHKKSVLRYGLIGGGAVAGGAVLFFTGGLAAPAIVAGAGFLAGAAAGVGVVGVGMTSFAASVAAFGGLSTALGLSFGAAGAGLVGYKVARRTGDLKEFDFELIDCSPGLPVTIGVHGWLNDDTDTPWKVWGDALVADGFDGGESLAISWETHELRALGQAISKLIESQAQSYMFGVAGSAALGAAFAAIALPLQIISLCDYVDNSWSVVQARADKAGEQLARALLSRTHGNRPVTLIGFGMGARVIIKCLLALADSPMGTGIVETAVLMGTPYPADALEYAKACSVCAHRLVNAFNSRDWLLSFAYRATSANISGIAGLKAVEAINGSQVVLENVDLTGLLSPSHFQYRDKLTSLVQALGAHTGVVDLTLITPDDTVSTLLSRVKDNVPKLPDAASTIESIKSWRPIASSATLCRSASEAELLSMDNHDATPFQESNESAFCTRAVVLQHCNSLDTDDRLDLPPRPYSR